MTEGAQPTTPTPPPLLHKGFRFGSGVAALVGFGVGGWAVFETDNEVGSTALLAIGLFFSIVAMLGRIPRIKLGDNEIDPGEAYAAGARDGADVVADAATQAALETDDPKKVAEAARTAESALLSAWAPNRLKLVRTTNARGVHRVNVIAQNGQIVGTMDDWPGLWTEPPTPPPAEPPKP